MTRAPLERFTFDTVFDDEGAVVATAPRPKRVYTVVEVEAIRAAARGEGAR